MYFLMSMHNVLTIAHMTWNKYIYEIEKAEDKLYKG